MRSVILLESLATNKSWVLGGEKFIEKFERRVGVAGKTAGHGGDRKSKTYKNQRL